MVTEIVEESEGEEVEITFTKLQKLRLEHLQSLTSFCSGNYGFSFPCLNELIVEECPRMKLFSPGQQLNTPKLRNVYLNLKQNKKRWEGNLNATIQQLHTEMVGFEGFVTLTLSEFPELREIWHGQFPVKLFSQLWYLTVDGCSYFSTAVPFNLMPYLGNLNSLSVSECDSLERVFDLPRLHHIFPTHPPPTLEFKNLGSLKLRNCSSLKNVLTTTMALCLAKLMTIEIINCIALEEIITQEENAGESVAKVQDIFIFPQLQIIVLDSLPNLISFNSGSGILEFSSLEKITVDHCPNMKPFISSFLRGHGSKAADEIQRVATTSLIDDDKVAFPKLTKLRMDWNDAMEEIGRGQFEAKFFCQLRTLAIINLPDHHLTFPSHFLLRFLNVESLTLENAMLEEITIHEGTNGENTSVGSLEKLRKLTLSNLPSLVHLGRKGSPLCSMFENLETLKVFECGILETLLPSTISFQSLTTLQVSKCHKLLYLMTCTAAKSLALLTRMSITECQMLEKIVENVENVAESGLTLTKLECLELHCLPSLVDFSLWNCALKFPSLHNVVVRECPKMKIFSQGVITAPKLRRVRLTEGKEKWCWEGSLNATIQKLYMDQAILQSSQPSSPKRSNLDVEAGQLVRNGKSPMSEGPNSEDFYAIKNPNVTKYLSPDTITKHNEAEEDPIQDRSLSSPMGIRSISQAQMDDCLTDQDNTIPPSSTEQSVSVCERPASDSCKDQFSKPVFKGLLPEHKMTQIPSTYQHSRAIAEYDQEDPTLNQSSSTAMEMGNGFVSQEKVLSDAIPTPFAAPEPAIVSTSDSKNRTLSSLELTSSLFSKPSSKPPSFPITEMESMNHASSSKKPPNITPSSFQPAISVTTPAESCTSILETDGYSMSMHVMKNVLSKPLTEVASSTDRVLLLSTMKNLRKCQCHLLNAQQIEAIQVFIENFDSFVAYHPFHENQIEQVGAFKLRVEDKKKGIAMLKNHYEDLAQKSTSLCADKEALIKRLREIEEEEEKIREDMEDVCAKIATDSGTLEEAYNFFLPEFDRERQEAEAKVCTSNSQWAKIRSLFT